MGFSRGSTIAAVTTITGPGDRGDCPVRSDPSDSVILSICDVEIALAIDRNAVRLGQLRAGRKDAVAGVLADKTPADVLGEFGGAQFSTFKAALTDLAVAKLSPINSEMKRLLNDPAAIDAVLADGSARAQKLAGETMKAVKDIVGFVRS